MRTKRWPRSCLGARWPRRKCGSCVLPTLDALLFLHRKGLVHGRLKPSNFLAVNDQLKLASDSIRPINHTAGGSDRTSAYDPPEVKDRAVNAAGDIWGLGMTLLEALTQRTTAWPDESVSVPADLPGPFANTVLRCLSVAPGARPTALDIEAQLKPTAANAAQSGCPVTGTSAVLEGRCAEASSATKPVAASSCRLGPAVGHRVGCLACLG